MPNKVNDPKTGFPEEWLSRLPTNWLNGAPPPWLITKQGTWVLPQVYQIIAGTNQKYRFVLAMQSFAEALARSLAASKAPRAKGPTVFNQGDYLYDVYVVWAGLVSFMDPEQEASALIAELEIGAGVMSDPENAQRFADRICHAIGRLEGR